MQKKWYFVGFIIGLAFFGFTKEQKIAPNQEIVIQFNDNEVTAVDTKSAIANVKNQLQEIGINSIEVNTLQNGQLKITYYSATDARSIKDILSKENKIGLDFTSKSQNENQSSIPFNKKDKVYNLDVYKIQDSSDSNSGFDGKLAIELKPESDRFFNPIVDNFATKIEDRKRDRIFKIAFKLYRNIAIAIDNTSHNIPEVRAGPIPNGNS